MGRKVYRVALDFSAPQDEVWPGFLNPHYKKCEACKGTSYTEAYEALQTVVRRLMLAGSDSLTPGKPLHPYLREMGITAVGDLHILTTGLAGRAPWYPGFGHDSSDTWSATKKIIVAAGLPETWGVCASCEGSGIDPSVKAAYDAWTPTEPPSGPGWQMWETTTEGSPISPVFDTPEALARWLADTRASMFGDDGAAYAVWLGFIQGADPTADMLIGGFYS